MSDVIGTYSFLPWLREGLANLVQPPSGDGGSRVTVPVALTLTGEGLDGTTLREPVQRTVEIYGPGDVEGIDGRAIVKTEPDRPVTNFEPNYLPFIEFYDEDFPWRYTPEVPAGNRLRPWIMLVVLKEDEFEERQGRGRLSVIGVPGAEDVFPPIDQLWAWAHVHVDEDLAASPTEIASTDMDAVLARLAAVLRRDPDLARSRILCPRKLDANTTYHGFLVPVFESGRLAGLGLDPSGTPAVGHGAWEPASGKAEPESYPYYHHWSFKTGTVGDFEYLVRQLEPRPMDSRVGRRDIDVQDPGANLSGITDPELGGVLRLGGALRVPLSSFSEEELAEYRRYEEWDRASYPHPFQRDLAAFVNLADDYAAKAAADANAATSFDATIPDPDNPGQRIPDPDPLITPPLYGRWHALTARLLVARDDSRLTPDDDWVHQLNLDPRHRAAAGLGTEVVQQRQEEYVDAAWRQVGEVLEANRRIRLAQLAKQVGQTWYDRTVAPLAERAATMERALLVTRPVQGRVLTGGVTVRHLVAGSRVPLALSSTTARRVLRPRGRVIRTLPFDEQRTPGNLVTRVNDGEVTAAPPKPPLEGAPTLDDLADGVRPPGIPPFVERLLRRFPWLPLALAVVAAVLLVLAVLLLPVLPVALLLLAAAVGLGWAAQRLRRWQRGLAAADSVRPEAQTPAAVGRYPNSPDFRVVEPGDPFRAGTGTTDSVEAVRYKAALTEAYTLLEATRRADVPVRRLQVDLPALVTGVVAALDPGLTIPRSTYQGVLLPPRVVDQIGEAFVEAMAYPEIDAPMYRPLVAKSVDAFLPNLQFVPQNSISLIETNQPFIEAYMVGLNHEFARELLWREYPTDQRGSYFRQFWDVTGYLDTEGLGPEELRERLKDIPPLHRWARGSRLGDHDHRERGGEAEEEVVLVIRGELLKKYPRAVIYAHRARWQLKQDGTIDPTVERRLEDPGAADAPSPPPDKVKTPLFEAKVDPDVYFFGFDLKVEEARGGTGEQPDDDPGWFFVIKERSGEPRFGLDIEPSEELHVWNDLGWGNVVPDVQPGDHLQITPETPTITLTPLPPGEDEQAAQAADDQFVRWHAGADAAELAYILQQVPVLVAVHAAEMLPPPR